ncbi:NAD(P)H-dependent flavin oxidoreductase [Actinoplanes awajinensis]|uniref:2-nitropropane dioxygenase n=1 Tax=Actinoplanes awajinensis subsp. mycoplanecinus TaxID=135947 RepID=A0A117MPF2_9ACTN|nr:nitronate monooxygenase [Actinoplanes awajinensis]KUL28507.1 2-nitropropane dioxygenase [Actinoplanes awajinensis subsp. mycoplanecinus]
MELRTRFTAEFGLTTPIAQAGMAFVAMTPELPVAVSNAGALGALGVGMLPAPALTQVIAGIKAGTDRPFNVNFITGFTQDDQIDAVCAAGVPVASFHWGHPPRAWIDRLQMAGVRVFEQVGTVDAAKRAVDAGVDVVVAQGLEAGGHNYATLPTFVLVPLVVDAVAPALVLAAGGIADGRGLAAALMLGADGAWIGTRLVATDESGAHEGYKERLVAAEATETVRTSLFGPETPEFNPMRILRNRVTEQPPAADADRPVIGRTSLGGPEIEIPRFSNLVPTRATSGDLEEMPLLAGQGVGLVDGVKGASSVIADITAQAVDVLGRYRPVM